MLRSETEKFVLGPIVSPMVSRRSHWPSAAPPNDGRSRVPSISPPTLQRVPSVRDVANDICCRYMSPNGPHEKPAVYGAGVPSFQPTLTLFWLYERVIPPV